MPLMDQKLIGMRIKEDIVKILLDGILFDTTTLALQLLQAAGLRDEPDAAAAEASS